MKIALDAMGGDFGPSYLVAGAVMALREYSHIKKLFLVGDTKQIESELKKHKCNDRRINIVHSTQVVDMSDRAWSAVRRKKDSSISRAVDLVKRGEADAIVSAGHTGAAVAASMIKLRTLEGSKELIGRALRPCFPHNLTSSSWSTPAPISMRAPNIFCSTRSWVRFIRATFLVTKAQGSV